MLIFSEAHKIIQEIEMHLVSGFNSEVSAIRYFERVIWLPFQFLKMGVSEIIKGAAIWAFLSFALLILLSFFIKKDTTDKDLASALLWISMLVPMLLVMFAMPSTYTNSGIDQKTVSFIVQYLQKRGFSNPKDIDLLKKSIKLFEDRARSRVNILDII